MDRKPNHRCRVCGAEYYACNDCAQKHVNTYGMESWRVIAESITHYQIYMVLTAYTRNEITAAEARDQLTHLSVSESDRAKLYPQIQTLISKILDDPIPEKTEEEASEPSDEVIETVAPVSDETIVSDDTIVTDADQEPATQPKRFKRRDRLGE